MDRSLFTAKFKRDYVAASAVVIFCLIVISEITLAVGIPTYLLRSDIWALQIKRQQLLSSFDSLRNYCNEAQIKETAADEENKIVLWTLNLMANYLRLHRQTINAEEIAAIQQDITDLRLIAGRAIQGKNVNQEMELNPQPFLTALTRQVADSFANSKNHESK